MKTKAQIYYKKWSAENRDRINENTRLRAKKIKLLGLEPAEKKEARLKKQCEYNAKNKQRIAEYKKQYHIDNLEKVRAQQKAYRLKAKAKTVIPMKPEKVKKPMPLFEILDVLRKDNRHYLWGVKSVLQWTEKDWTEFNKLKSA